MQFLLILRLTWYVCTCCLGYGQSTTIWNRDLANTFATSLKAPLVMDGLFARPYLAHLHNGLDP
jgi:hypothetical protein